MVNGTVLMATSIGMAVGLMFVAIIADARSRRKLEGHEGFEQNEEDKEDKEDTHHHQNHHEKNDWLTARNRILAREGLHALYCHMPTLQKTMPREAIWGRALVLPSRTDLACTFVDQLATTQRCLASLDIKASALPPSSVQFNQSGPQCTDSLSEARPADDGDARVDLLMMPYVMRKQCLKIGRVRLAQGTGNAVTLQMRPSALDTKILMLSRPAFLTAVNCPVYAIDWSETETADWTYDSLPTPTPISIRLRPVDARFRGVTYDMNPSGGMAERSLLDAAKAESPFDKTLDLSSMDVASMNVTIVHVEPLITEKITENKQPALGEGFTLYISPARMSDTSTNLDFTFPGGSLSVDVGGGTVRIVGDMGDAEQIVSIFPAPSSSTFPRACHMLLTVTMNLMFMCMLSPGGRVLLRRVPLTACRVLQFPDPGALQARIDALGCRMLPGRGRADDKSTRPNLFIPDLLAAARSLARGADLSLNE